MELLLLIVGVVMLLLTAGDMVWTAVRVDSHSGPITHLVSRAVWMFFAARQRRGKSAGPPQAIGFIMALAILVVWLLLIALAWFLIFVSRRGAVVDSDTGEPVDGWAVPYYTMYVLSTLGMGEYVPSRPVWQIPDAGHPRSG
ncbi:hypothetical protein [Pseudonocardia sp. H11422]|uniref:hypothetical protein n=1 Tax=Pseudonocardia sp. H11422 TaxID=2835866 RepID=UPI001BDCF214|nr:hypothetical protein [Pseudonocardia sp. H11422]